MNIFENDRKLVIVPKIKYESREHYILRSYFILNNIEIEKFENLINLSFLFLNYYHLGYEYNNETINRLNKFNCDKL